MTSDRHRVCYLDTVKLTETIAGRLWNSLTAMTCLISKNVTKLVSRSSASFNTLFLEVCDGNLRLQRLEIQFSQQKNKIKQNSLGFHHTILKVINDLSEIKWQVKGVNDRIPS